MRAKRKRQTSRLDEIETRLDELARERAEQREQSRRWKDFVEADLEAGQIVHELAHLDESEEDGQRWRDLVHSLLAHMVDYENSTGVSILFAIADQSSDTGRS